MVGTGDGHKMSHAIIGNAMTHIENHMHVVFLKKQKKFSLLNWNKNFYVNLHKIYVKLRNFT